MFPDPAVIIPFNKKKNQEVVLQLGGAKGFFSSA